MDFLSAPSPLLVLIAWACVTFSPIALAMGFWTLAERMRPRWVAHLLFLPCLIGVEWASLWLLFYAANDNGDGPPGLGFAILPAFGILVLTVLAYYAALIIKAILHKPGA